MSNDNFPLGREELLRAYRTMKTIREFEERVHVEFATGDLPGFVHLYAGEEASATGIMLNLRQDDHIASTHRGHGHCIAKGVDVRGMFAELYGRATGTCRGKGGSHAHRRYRPGHDGGQRHPRRRRAAGVRRGAGIQVQEGRQRGGQLRRRRRLQRRQLPGEPQPGRGVGAPGHLRGGKQRLRPVHLARLRHRGGQLRGPRLRVRDAGRRGGRHRLLRRLRGCRPRSSPAPAKAVVRGCWSAP